MLKKEKHKTAAIVHARRLFCEVHNTESSIGIFVHLKEIH